MSRFFTSELIIAKLLLDIIFKNVIIKYISFSYKVMITGGYVQFDNVLIPFNVIEYYAKAKCYIKDNKIFTKAKDIEIDVNWLIAQIDNEF